MIEEGADWLDVGGESTRPGSVPVSEEEEFRRVIPVLRALKKSFPKVPISIDTQKSRVAEAALSEGASIVNDVSALTADPLMAAAVLRRRPRVVLMHMKGAPSNMQAKAKYRNVVREVRSYLASRALYLTRRGFPRENIIIDPGLGFGKNLTQNLEILYNVRKFTDLGFPVLIGASRKSFIGRILGTPQNPVPPGERLEGSLACALWAASEGASILRVHDVGATRKALSVWESLAGKKMEKKTRNRK